MASTKAFTGQVTVLTMLALMIARVKGTIDQECSRKIAKHLLDLPAVLEEVLRLTTGSPTSRRYSPMRTTSSIWDAGTTIPRRLEGALKLKEISYIHAEGYPAAEMKHGPIALIDAEMPTIAIATPDHTYEKTASNIEEIKARGRQGNHRNRQGRRAGTQEFGLLYRSARRGGVSDADRGIGAAAVAGVSYRCQ